MLACCEAHQYRRPHAFPHQDEPGVWVTLPDQGHHLLRVGHKSLGARPVASVLRFPKPALIWCNDSYSMGGELRPRILPGIATVVHPVQCQDDRQRFAVCGPNAVWQPAAVRHDESIRCLPWLLDGWARLHYACGTTNNQTERQQSDQGS